VHPSLEQLQAAGVQPHRMSRSISGGADSLPDDTVRGAAEYARHNMLFTDQYTAKSEPISDI